MKVRNLLLSTLVAVLFCNISFAQDTIAAWTFPASSADSLVDVSTILNSTSYISCVYGTNNTPSYYAIAIDYTTNGADILTDPTDKSAKVVGLNDGADSVAWTVKFKTTGYQNIKLSSKQTAGGNNPGPRDFKAQYKLSDTSTWVDITNGTVLCANNWTSGVLSNVDLPAACNNSTNNVSIRFLQTSNTDINGGTVAATGISKIDNIVITGEAITGIDSYNNNNLNIYPNPNKGSFIIENNGDIKQIRIFNILGKNIYINESVIEGSINFNAFEAGVYFVQVTLKDNVTSTSKLVVE